MLQEQDDAMYRLKRKLELKKEITEFADAKICSLSEWFWDDFCNWTEVELQRVQRSHREAFESFIYDLVIKFYQVLHMMGPWFSIC